MSLTVLQGDWIEQLRSLGGESVQCCVTSPPYWGLRDYGMTGQLGLEKTPEEYVAKIVAGFREVRRVLKNDGTLWLNLGDSYANDVGGETGGKQYYLGAANRQRVGREKRLTGLKPKDLVGIPWMVAFALRADGWWLRSDIIWSKPNPMPESVTDRCTKAHEYIFLITKSATYYYDASAIAEPLTYGSVEGSGKGYAKPYTSESTKDYASGGAQDASATKARIVDRILSGEITTRNKRSVWTVTIQPFKGSHFATFPPDLIKPCILAGSRPGDTVLDPFAGSGTTGMVALELGRKALLVELNPQYISLINQRCNVTPGLGI